MGRKGATSEKSGMTARMTSDVQLSFKSSSQTSELFGNSPSVAQSFFLRFVHIVIKLAKRFNRRKSVENIEPTLVSDPRCSFQPVGSQTHTRARPQRRHKMPNNTSSSPDVKKKKKNQRAA